MTEYTPRFSYTDKLVTDLGVIEAARAVIEVLPLPADTALRLRHDAFEKSTRASVAIEGNTLDQAAVRKAIADSERTGVSAEIEVRNYWRALDRIEEFAENKHHISEAFNTRAAQNSFYARTWETWRQIGLSSR